MNPRTPEDYRGVLLDSFPPGIAFPRIPDSIRGKTMLAIGDSLSRAEVAAYTMAVLENDPRTADAMLPEWAELTGVEIQDDHAATVALVMARIRARGGQSQGYFIGIAAALGITITITENRPLRFGAHFGDRFGLIDWAFVWDVNAPVSAESSPSLEKIIRRFAPAHTLVRFFYS
jgi:uncharacterized protein YmfQ (DUF2313 family)